MGNRAKRFAKYYNQCKLPTWASVLGVVLLAFGIVAAGITAIFHDKYPSIFGAWESALTNVWFIAFLALMGVGALISLGYPLLTAIGAGIWVLLSKPEPEVIKEHRRLAVRPRQLYKYFRRIYNSFTEWCCTLFECMYLEPPKRENIKKPLEISNQLPNIPPNPQYSSMNSAAPAT